MDKGARVNGVSSISIIGFFTFMMFWTLNSTSGEDMNDMVVRWMKAEIAQMEQTTRHIVEVK